MASSNTIFAQKEGFWNNYLKGRPQAPQSLFNRIFSYHASQNGTFGTVHDAGAGNGPYSHILREKFEHVIVSDIVPSNVSLAQQRLGTNGFTYRTASIEQAEDIPAGSVDMVFATNVMHFADQTIATNTIAKQLKSGGTLFCGTFGPARFYNKDVQDLWQAMSYEGGRALLKKAEKMQDTVNIMARSKGNLAPLDETLWLPSAKRIDLNMGKTGIITMLPPEEESQVTEPSHVGIEDEAIDDVEDGWGFEMDLENVKQHMLSFPFIADYEAALSVSFGRLEELLEDGKKVKGVFPARIILATRR
jgi:SAM-dependent methyltransferase